MTITRLSFLVFFLSLAACASVARVIYPLNEDPHKTLTGKYELDPTHANIIFAVNHLGFSLHHGRFNDIEGSIQINPDKPENSSVFIKVDVRSIDTNNKELDDKLKAQKMFNTEQHPYASFQSTHVALTGPKAAIITGDLTLKNIRRSVTLNATFIGSGTNPLTGKKTIGFSGTAKFNRADFDLKEWLPLVGNEVSLILEAEFIKP